MAHAPRILGHRGASAATLENTVAAFRQAIDDGADGVELDIHATRDGALVVHHDATIAGLGAIAELGRADLAGYRLPNGEQVPTLADALAAIGMHEAWIEVKALPASRDDVLIGELRRGPAPDLYGIHSFDHSIIRRLARREPGLRFGVLLCSRLVDPTRAMEAAGASVLWQEWPMIDERLVEEVHAIGGEVIAWTVNGRTEAARLARLGVDALCGNDPAQLRRWTR